MWITDIFQSKAPHTDCDAPPKEESAPQSQAIDFNAFTLAEICADPELVRAYREQHPFAPHEVRENISCPKLGYGYRSKRDCLKCSEDKYCIMPLLENPYAMEAVQ